ncbi:ABC transporter permease [Bacillus solimangrovi]|uniref:ABC transporter ATP-binding protein n=1 Tax=Bacillus solimangrovi TaxID=1305675 RepID=A0A1E5LHL0_9BACI|nr:ABC transporter permease [Bacillus solimangrovi]OEH93574.1 ABC transporter ATP-binding protein [Bacillus solimangrovi]
MSKMWSICLIELKKVFKKPSSYFVMFIMPILFTFIFGSMFGDEQYSKPLFALVDEDQSLLSETFKENIEQNRLFSIELLEREEAIERVRDKSLTGLIIVSKGFAQEVMMDNQPIIDVHYSPDFLSIQAVEQTIVNAITDISIHVAAANVWSNYHTEDWELLYSDLTDNTASLGEGIEVVNIAQTNKTGEQSNMSARAAGFAIMFVMFEMLSVTGVFLEARKEGIWYRLLATPISKVQLLGGYLLSFFLIGWLQFGILMFVSSLLFKVVWGDLFANIILVSALILCVVGLGLFLASIVRTVEQQSAIGTIVIVSTCMLGGVYWPLEIVPEFMQTIANFIPQTWAMKGFNHISAGSRVADIIPNVIILMSFAVAFIGIGLKRVKYE